ncbi:hypothetical protein A8L34_19455 [Bacillus sp. FJAT-27264]|uniref:hypothetical protein n=1 Tax=Paenibacillus sp. (strain DSM 101736 / FJAT-27264) TaxID=1850362 RepID=UPI000807CED6|nr:hypothetical protein [Bacillus sp. FJAT-27264]OBZ10747.1 hypothetical protein A8L34_19455 [Bacillus sp. FJAT-27264]
MHINVVSQTHKGMILLRSLKKRNQVALLYVKSSLAIEGIILTPQENQLLLDRSNGRMKNADFLARALEMAKNV